MPGIGLTDNQVLMVKYFCNDGRQNGINVVHYRTSDVVGGGITDQLAADALSTLAAAQYKAYLNADCGYAGVQAQVVYPGLYPTVRSIAGAGVGINLTDRLPSQVALLLSPRTNSPGRRGRGRCYLPFWSEDQNSPDGQPTAGAITAATNVSNVIFAVQTVTSGANSVKLTPVIYSRVTPVTITPIQFVLFRANWASQRRRADINRPDQLGP